MTHIQILFIIFIALLQLLERISSHLQYARYTHDFLFGQLCFRYKHCTLSINIECPTKKNIARLVTDHPHCPTPPVGFQITSQVSYRGKMGFEEIVANFNFICTKLLGL